MTVAQNGKCGLRWLLFSLWAFGLGPLGADPNLVLEIPKAERPPIVDGAVEEWEHLRWIYFGPGALHTLSTGNHQLEDDGAAEQVGTALTPADLSGYFALQWDDEKLYLAARVTDNVHDVEGGIESQWYFRDTVALLLDTDLDGGGSEYRPGDHIFAFTADPTYPPYGKWWRQGGSTGSVERPAPASVQWKVRLGEQGHYTLEAAIPMALLTEHSPGWRAPFEEQMLGFGLLVTDPDHGSVTWGGQIAYGFRTDADRTWSKLKLQPADKNIRLSAARPAVAGGEAKTAPAGRGVRQGVKRTFREKDGLPFSVVFALLQDRQGQVWMGTSDAGLVCYDGENFTTFTVSDGLPGNDVGVLLEDRAGHIWLGSQSGGLARYDGEGFTTFTVTDGLAHNEVLALLEDRRGHLWIGTQGGLSRYDGQRFRTFTTADGLAHDTVWALAADGLGRLWIGTSAGLSHYDGTTFTTYTTADGLGANGVRVLVVDGADQLWTGTQGGGVCRFDGADFVCYTIEEGLSDNWVRALALDGAGQLLVGTYKGLCRYAGTRFVPLPEGSPVLAILVDREGHLWGSTREGNVFQYDGLRLSSLTTEDGLVHNGVAALLEDRQGHLWIGTLGGISRYDGQLFVPFSAEEEVAKFRVLSLYEDKEGGVWVGSNGASRYDGQTFRRFGMEDGLGGTQVRAIFQDWSGDMWFGLVGGGVSRYDGRTFTNFKAEDGLVSNIVYSIFQDRSSNLLVSTPAGLSRYDGQRFSSVGLPMSMRVFQDQSGNLWAGAVGGLSRYDGRTLTTFGTEDGLPRASFLFSFFQDRSGNLWFGTDEGVIRYDGQIFQHLDVEDGLISNEIWALYQDSSGTIWVGTPEGVMAYRPNSARPFVRLTDVVADRQYGPVERVRLPSSQEVLAFAFESSRFRIRPENTVYLHRLQGYDDNWQVTREKRRAYRDLPPGAYTFEVIAVDQDLNRSAPASVAVEVFHQPSIDRLTLGKARLEPVFASFYRSYAHQPLGQIQIENSDTEPVEATLRFVLPGLMRQTFETHLTLAPQTTQAVSLHAQLDPEVLALTEKRTVAAELELSFTSGEETLSRKRVQELTIYGRGTLRWDQVGRAAAFITPTDPSVAAFARPLLVDFEAETASYGQPGQNLVQALLLFSALKQHGIRYVADANTPYARVAADQAAIDHIQYPAELLQSRAGDCDDLTALYCSLLENAGVATVLVDYPGHIFLLFDSGVERRQLYQLPLDARQYVLWGDRVWIPLEVTLLAKGFHQAWRAGAEQIGKMSTTELKERLVTTAHAWVQFPPTKPVFEGQVAPPDRRAFERAFATQCALLQGLIDEHIDKIYRMPLQVDPHNDGLRTQLIKLYLALRQFDKAIERATTDLLKEYGDKGATFNQLGNAYALQGNMSQAALYYKQAAALRPQDKGIQQNLARALEAVGLAQPTRSDSVGGSTTDRPKDGAVATGLERFYWVE